MKSPANCLYIFAFSLLISCCKNGPNPEPIDPNDLTNITYNPKDYVLQAPSSFPEMQIPVDNKLTEQGVLLGRKLFYDPILSADSSMACASCHLQKGNFTDNLKVSEGIDRIAGKRSSMSLLNIGYVTTGLFWDGRADNLEEQALLPVEDPIELHHTWPEVIDKLKQHVDYPKLFREAFGINNKMDITRELAAKAIAQFERTLVSSGNSKFDRVQRNEIFFTDEELDGFLMFFDEDPLLPDAECGHCHNKPLFTTDEFINNGIEPISNLEDFPDKGRGGVTSLLIDQGKFRVPSLRNIEFSGPYMHDGRFETLEEVLDHYNSGGHLQANKDVLVLPLNLDEGQKQAIIAFLKTLSDPEFLNNPKYSDPN